MGPVKKLLLLGPVIAATLAVAALLRRKKPERVGEEPRPPEAPK